MRLPSFHPAPLPDAAPQLEEAAAALPADGAAALAFALWRVSEGRAAAEGDPRPLAIAAPRVWLRERGRPFAQGAARLGLDPRRLLLIAVDRETEVLWAMEEALKSGAVAGAVGAAATAPFVMTRRLDFAARAGRARGILLRVTGAGDLSAARLRWRIGSAPSAANPFDPRAPGAARITAELVRSRDGRGGSWILEQDDETHRFRLAAGLAGDGLVEGGRTIAAA